MEDQNQNKVRRYVTVEGQRVYLTPEQQAVWDKEIRRARTIAQKEGTCGQPDYHFCSGDCLECRWHVEGKFVSIDEQNNGSGVSN